MSFAVRQLMGKMATITLVRVQAVTNAGGITASGTVDVLPLVNQVDGAGRPTPHGTVFGLPYVRLQGGGDAVILDPKVGDIGIALFASHDISAVKATGAQANPGSRRRYDMADGLYIGGVLNGVPSQIIRFSASGIAITSPTAVTINAPSVTITAPAIHLN